MKKIELLVSSIAGLQSGQTSLIETINEIRGTQTEQYIQTARGTQAIQSFQPMIIRSLGDLARFISCTLDEKDQDIRTRSLQDAFNSKSFEPSMSQIEAKYVKRLIAHIYANNATIIDSLMRAGVDKVSAQELFEKPSSIHSHVKTQRDSALEAKILQYSNASPSDRKYMLETNDGFGLFLFSLTCSDTPAHELEFDSVPVVKASKDVVFVEVFEHKSSRSMVGKAAKQIKVRLDILSEAIHVTQDKRRKTYKRGTVFLPRSSKFDPAEPLPVVDYELTVQRF